MTDKGRGTYRGKDGHLRNKGDGTRVYPAKGVTFSFPIRHAGMRGHKGQKKDYTIKD